MQIFHFHAFLSRQCFIIGSSGFVNLCIIHDTKKHEVFFCSCRGQAMIEANEGYAFLLDFVEKYALPTIIFSVTSCYLCTNILLSTPFSNNISLCFSCKTGD
jgi:hypothetical protein